MKRKNELRLEADIDALASLGEGEIDTSEIPEAKDWRGAIRGRFHRGAAGGVKVLLKDRESKRLRKSFRAWVAGLWRPYQRVRNFAKTIDPSHSAKLSQASEDAWTELVRRFHRLIMFTIKRSLLRWGGIESPDLIDDLTQVVYVRLFTALGNQPFSESGTLLPYVRAVAQRVALEHSREHHRQHPAASSRVKTTADVPDGASQLPDDLTEALGQLAKAAKKASERDRLLLRFYLHGLTASQISELPHIKMTESEVKASLARFIRPLQGIKSQT
jgi:RNA polymerase sigma factor (sigma-70 family)